MESQAKKSSLPLSWIASLALILFSVIGIAAIMGWIPSSMGRSAEAPPAVQLEPGPAPKPTADKARPAARRVDKTAASPARCVECGVIESVREVNVKGTGSGVGAVGGAIVGGLLGNQVGGGSGKTIATVAGAVGGVVAGNEIEKRVKASRTYDITVRLDDGSRRTFHQATASTWRVGEPVKIIDGAIRSN